MSSQKHIQDELRCLGSQLPLNTIQPFAVPEGYFDGLAVNILATIKGREDGVQAELAELSPLLASLPKQMPYALPSSFFEESSRALDAITQPENSSVLQTIGKENPYQVPANYFVTLPELMLSKVAKPKARVVPMFARTWMRVASAAAVAGALFFGGYQLLKNDEAQTRATTTAVQEPSSKEDKLVASNLVPIEKEIKKVPTQELEEFIQTVQVSTPKVREENTVSSNNEVEDLLKDVPTSEMESFLSALPTADDELLIID